MTDDFENGAVRKGSVLMDQGRYKEAAVTFKDALSSNPNDAHLIHLLATCYYHISNQLELALAAIDQSLQLEPEEPYHYNLKSMILADSNKPKKALEEINRSLEIEAGWSYTFAVQSYIYIKMEKWANAEAAARAALAINADDDFAGNMLATALNMQNKLDESAHLTSDMLAKDPEDSFAHSSRGWVYFHRKNYDQAQIHFKEALRLNPNFESARIVDKNLFPNPSPWLAPLTNPAISTKRIPAGVNFSLLNSALRTVSRSSGNGTTPIFGSMVVNGKFSAAIPAPVSALNKEDLPTFGNPTIPISIICSP